MAPWPAGVTTPQWRLVIRDAIEGLSRGHPATPTKPWPIVSSRLLATGPYAIPWAAAGSPAGPGDSWARYGERLLRVLGAIGA